MLTNSPIKVFFSYSHKDNTGNLKYRDELDIHLSALKNEGQLVSWYDGDIEAGGDISKQTFLQKLNDADIILLLVSHNFMASDFIQKTELTKAIERHNQEKARVIPIILTPCDGWEQSSFGQCKALPKDGKPIESFDRQNEAYAYIATEIRKVIENWTKKKQTVKVHLQSTLQTSL